jgi:DNA-binding beta-propeller fold protein YncE
MVLADPKGIAVDAVKGEVFVSDYGDPAVGISASIKVFDLSGALVRTITGNFSRPQGLALTDSKLFVADNMLAQILEFDRTTDEMTTSYGCLGSSEGHMLLPLDVALDAEGLNLYVADNRNMRVTVLPLTESQ